MTGADPALLHEVDRFVARAVSPEVRRPERPMAAAALAELLARADALGLAGDVDGAPTGQAPWDTLVEGIPGSELAVLERLGRANAAVALCVHARALARAIARHAGLAAPARAWPALDGALGLGRVAWARAIAGAPLAALDRACLADAYAADATRLVPLEPGLEGLVTVRWRDGGGLALALHRRDALALAARPHAHGLDELALFAVRPRGPGLEAALDATATRALVSRAAAAWRLGLVAIACGAVRHAHAVAARFAAGRRQGGATIDRHAAVLGLLGRASATLTTTGAALAASGREPGPALALASHALPALADAASAALQVLGGLGYMRDAGLEKVLRDVNCLRSLAGSPRELELVAAELERLEAEPERGQGDRLRPGSAPSSLAGVERSSGAGDACAPAEAGAEADALPGHVAPTSALSPRAAFARLPRVVRALVDYPPLDPWEQDTRGLPPALARWRRRLRRFAETYIRPAALAVDAAPHPAAGELAPAADEILRAAGRCGLLTDMLPAPLGTANPRLFAHPLAFASALKTEELAAADGGLMLLVCAHGLGVAPLLLSGELSAIRRFVLPAFRACRAGRPQVLAYAITEPAAGSDVEDGHGASAYRPGVIARRVADGWSLTGRKCFISGGDVASGVVVFAALEGEAMTSWTAFFVPAPRRGLRVARTELKMGMRASGAAELELDAVTVPADHVIGGLRGGWALNRAVLNLSRIPVAAMGVGFARAATEAATTFACRARLGGRPLVAYQDVQLELADMLAETQAARAMVWAAAARRQAVQREASAAKVVATDTALRVCTRAMDLMGNHGLAHAGLVEKAYRDARLTQIFEGTNQINRLAMIEDVQERLLATIAALRGGTDDHR